MYRLYQYSMKWGENRYDKQEHRQRRDEASMLRPCHGIFSILTSFIWQL